MTEHAYILAGTLLMAGVTYLIRMIPVTFFRRKITGRFMKSFLYYVPYVCLSAMTFPAILTASGNLAGGVLALACALVAAWKGRSLVEVSLCACAAVFLVEVMVSLQVFG